LGAFGLQAEAKGLVVDANHGFSLGVKFALLQQLVGGQYDAGYLAADRCFLKRYYPTGEADGAFDVADADRCGRVRF